jgi:predicted Rossmann-fold nucleotide-binding protein
VGAYYTQNHELIREYRVFTLDFDSDLQIERKRAMARVIDMVFVIEGGPGRLNEAVD